MDKDSRDAYRHVVSYLARHSTRSERQVAEAAVALASAARGMTHADDVAAARRAHVGYYLVDDGLARAQGADRLQGAVVASAA